MNWLSSLRRPRLPFFSSREEERTLGINGLKSAEVESEDGSEVGKQVAESERKIVAAGEAESAATSESEPDFSTISVQPVLSIADEEEVLQETRSVEFRQLEEIASGSGADKAIEQTGFVLIDEPSTENASEPSAEEMNEASPFAEDVASDAETPVPEAESEEDVFDEPIEFVIEVGADEADDDVATPAGAAAVAFNGQDTDPAVHIIADDMRRSATTEAEAPTHIPLFSDLSAQELVDISLLLDYRSVKTGTISFREGDPGDSMFFVSAGEVEVSRLRWGRRIKLANLGEGELFGEMSVLTGLPRTATVTAVKNTELLLLTKENLEKIFARHPEFEAEIRREYEDRILDNRRKALERRIAFGGGEIPGEEGIRFFEGSRMLRLRKVRSKEGQLLGQVKRSSTPGDRSSDGSWETRPSWLVQAVRAPEKKPQKGRDGPAVAFEPAHQLFANLSGRRETAKSAKSFTAKFGPLLWEGHYCMEHRPGDQTATADEEDHEAAMVDWRLPLSRFWSEQRRFQLLFRLGVVLSPNNAGIEGGWNRETPSPAKSRAELVSLLIENLEAFPEITRRFAAIASSEDILESRPDQSEVDQENLDLARCWLEALEKEIEESKGGWTDKEYTTWLAVAEAVLEILIAARNRCLRDHSTPREAGSPRPSAPVSSTRSISYSPMIYSRTKDSAFARNVMVSIARPNWMMIQRPADRSAQRVWRKNNWRKENARNAGELKNIPRSKKSALRAPMFATKYLCLKETETNPIKKGGYGRSSLSEGKVNIG